MTILLLRIMAVLVIASLVLSLTCFGYLLGTGGQIFSLFYQDSPFLCLLMLRKSMLFIYPWLIGVGISDALSFTVVVIVASIPLAIGRRCCANVNVLKEE